MRTLFRGGPATSKLPTTKKLVSEKIFPPPTPSAYGVPCTCMLLWPYHCHLTQFFYQFLTTFWWHQWICKNNWRWSCGHGTWQIPVVFCVSPYNVSVLVIWKVAKNFSKINQELCQMAMIQKRHAYCTVSVMVHKYDPHLVHIVDPNLSLIIL